MPAISEPSTASGMHNLDVQAPWVGLLVLRAQVLSRLDFDMLQVAMRRISFKVN